MSFSASTVSGLFAWWKADSLNLADAAAVTSWSDSSGNSRTLTQGTAANQPTYRTNLRNGYGGVRFDGTNDYLATSSVAWPSAVTVFAVLKKNWETAEYGGILGAASYGLTAGFGLITTGGAAQDWGNKNLAVFGTGYQSGENPRGFGGYGTIPNGSVQIIEAGIGSGNAYVKMGGTTVSTTGTSGACDTTSAPIYVGDTAAASFDAMEADIFEILVYERVVTSDESALIYDYLVGKYGQGVINICGFETGTTNECSATSSSGTGASAPSVSSSIVRPGGGAYSLKCSLSGNNSGTSYAEVNGLAANGTLANFSAPTSYHRFYVYFEEVPSSGRENFFLVGRLTSGFKLALCLNSSRQVVVDNSANTTVATSTAALSLTTWYRIEVMSTSSASASSYEVKIYSLAGSLLETLSGTAAQTSDPCTRVLLGKAQNLSTRAMVAYFDDWVVSDSSWVGPGACVLLAPNASGATQQWTAGTGSTFAEVDDVPTDSDTTYIQSTGSANDTALFDFGNIPISGTVNAVKLHAVTRENTSVTSATLLRLSSGGSDLDNTPFDGSTSYANRFLLATTDPSTSLPWTRRSVNLLQAGVKENNAVAMRASTIALIVDISKGSRADNGPGFRVIGDPSDFAYTIQFN